MQGSWTATVTETNGSFSGPATLTFTTLFTCASGSHHYCTATDHSKCPNPPNDACDLQVPFTFDPAVINGTNVCGAQPQLHFSFLEGTAAVFPGWAGNIGSDGTTASGTFSDPPDFFAGSWTAARVPPP